MDFSWLSDLFGGGGGGGGITDPGGLTEFGGGSIDAGSGGGGLWDSFASGLGKIDWGGLGGQLGKAAIPGLAALGTGAIASQVFPDTPGKQQLVDTRTNQQIGAQGQGLSRMTALQNNPASFGLPGDPNDVNTPAGRKKYDLTKTFRSGEAARGMLNTGGSAQRENAALNQAIGDSYNNIWSGAANVAQAGPGLTYATIPGQQNPWGKLVASAATPVASTSIEQLIAELQKGRA